MIKRFYTSLFGFLMLLPNASAAIPNKNILEAQGNETRGLESLLWAAGIAGFNSAYELVSLKGYTLLLRAKFDGLLAKMTPDEKATVLSFYISKAVPGNTSIETIKKPSTKTLQKIARLIEHGASPNVYGRIDCIYEVDDQFSNTDISDIYWQGVLVSPLYLFIVSNDLDNARMLLEKGAHLHEPVFEGGKWVYRYDSNLKTWHSTWLKGIKEYPLTCAQTKEMAELLLEYGAQIEPCLSKASHRFKLIDRLASPGYSADLIPFYLEHCKNPAEFAQKLLDKLNENEGYSHDYYEKRDILLQAGAVKK